MRKSEIRIIPKLCPPLSPSASESGGGHVPPRSYGGAAHGSKNAFAEHTRMHTQTDGQVENTRPSA